MHENNNIDNQECQPLKNIMYKTMLLNKNVLFETKQPNDISNLEKFLEAEKMNNENQQWCKINKTIKLKKLTQFIDVYSKEKKLNDDEISLLTSFLKDCIEKKKLSKVKDVVYDKINGTIKEIPCLVFANKNFSLKNTDIRISTLKSLTPKKNNGTIKLKINSNNKIENFDSDNEN
jgi:hypothetical protein